MFAVLFGIKLEELTRQLGVHLLDFFFFVDPLSFLGFSLLGIVFLTDLFSNGPALMVAFRMSDLMKQM